MSLSRARLARPPSIACDSSIEARTDFTSAAVSSRSERLYPSGPARPLCDTTWMSTAPHANVAFGCALPGTVDGDEELASHEWRCCMRSSAACSPSVKTKYISRSCDAMAGTCDSLSSSALLAWILEMTKSA